MTIYDDDALAKALQLSLCKSFCSFLWLFVAMFHEFSCLLIAEINHL